MTCQVCREKPARRNRRCNACSMWLRRHGTERPEHAIITHNQRRFETAFVQAALQNW